MRGTLFALAVVTVLSMTVLSSQARATCERYPTVEQEFAGSDFVFIAWVTSARMDWSTTEPDMFNGVEYVVRPMTTFKGEPPAELLLYSENSSSRFPMMVTGWYMLFLGPAADMGFGDETRHARAISNCGHSFELRSVPMALEPYPTELTFEQVMSLAPDRD